MSLKKQQIRNSFNKSCLERDKYCCVCCGRQATSENWRDILDVHHIFPRKEMPNNGFVKENGVTLCKIETNCHLIAEQYFVTGETLFGYSPFELSIKINKLNDGMDEKQIKRFTEENCRRLTRKSYL